MIVFKDKKRIFRKIDFKSEAELQKNILDFPELLNVITELNGKDYPLYILKREFGVYSGSIDFLALDAEANLYIIETKLATNPEQRRAIVGQVFEYASNLSKLTYEEFKAKCFDDKIPFEKTIFDYFSKHLGNEINLTENDYRTRISENLRNRQFVIVIIGDSVRNEIQSLIEFINQITVDSLSFLILEIKKYVLEGEEIFHSNIVWTEKYAKKLYLRNMINEEEYLKSKPEQIRKLIKYIDELCQEKKLIKSVNTNGLSWKHRDGGSIFITDDVLQTNWSTIHAKSEEIELFKKGTLKKAFQVGIKTLDTKYGKMSLVLPDQYSDEIKSEVNTFIDLAYSVMQKASEIEQHQSKAADVL